MSRANPYMNRLMIRDPGDFVGRSVEIEKVFSRVGASRPQSVSIVGERRIGKSSLLYHLSLPEVRRKHLHETAPYVFVFIDLHGFSGVGVLEFFDMLQDEIAAASGVDRPPKASNGYLSMKRFLPALERSGKKLVILWDEFDAITRNKNFGEEFFSFFRSVANRYDVAYVTSAAQELQDLCHTEAIAVSPFFNIFTNLRLRAFSPEDARELIRRPSERAGMPLQPHEPFLLDIAGYFPFFLQLACSALFDQLAAGTGAERAYERARVQFLDEAEPHLKYVWQHLSSESQDVLRKIAEGVTPVTRQGYAEDRLVRDGYLVASKDGTRVFSSIFAKLLSALDPSERPRPADPSAPGAPTVRSALERYTILREIGAGGMSTVNLAHDNLLDTDVALKVLHRDLYLMPGMLTRFRRETALARELHHPNICPVYDLVEAKDAYYIAMKFIDGVTLKSLIRESGPLAIDDAIGIARQVFRGLAAAHQVLVHRDLKPQNIMVDRQGRAYLLDFGLARTPGDPSLTMAGMVMGTPGYMSPEQIEGRTVGHRSDLYAAGAILFEMVTGRQPFTADDVDSLLALHRTLPPPRPSSFRPDLPPALESLILALLAKAPEARPATARDVVSVLDDVARERGIVRPSGDVTTRSFERPPIDPTEG